MRVVIQRVSHASVTIEGVCKSAIKEGFMILVGIEEADTQEDADWLCKKIIGLRVFDDENGVMNKSILEVGGNILVISQFTLHASTKKGNRPSYIRAAKHDVAIPLYNYFCQELSIGLGKEVGTGEFGADMKVELLNNGPVTICMDTKKQGIMTLEEAQKEVDRWIKNVWCTLLQRTDQYGRSDRGSRRTGTCDGTQIRRSVFQARRERQPCR